MDGTTRDDGRTVRDGYDAVADRYLHARPMDSPDIAALHQLTDRLPDGALVLDAGCGAGLPILRALSERYRVVGIDFSKRQLRLAREHVPAAGLACQDMTGLGLAPDSLDAICSYYAIIHIPRQHHARILAAFHRALRPGGLAFLCLGAEDLPADVDPDFYGAPMYWSHYDAATYLAMVADAGFEILWHQVIADSLDGDLATGAHLFLLARKAGE